MQRELQGVMIEVNESLPASFAIEGRGDGQEVRVSKRPRGKSVHLLPMWPGLNSDAVPYVG